MKRSSTIRKFWTALFVLAAVSPAGLILPSYLKSGDAWGEWDADGLRALVGYVPAGLKKFSSIWHAPLPDYAFKGWAEKGIISSSFAYVISAVLGMALAAAVVLLLGRFLARRDR